MELFGPLLDGMLMNKRLLPVLVRQTAINANRIVRFTQAVRVAHRLSRVGLIVALLTRATGI